MRPQGSRVRRYCNAGVAKRWPRFGRGQCRAEYLRLWLTSPAGNRTEAAIMPDPKYVAFTGRLVIVGFGSIGQGVLPLLLRHIELRPDQIVIITAEPRGAEVAA